MPLSHTALNAAPTTAPQPPRPARRVRRAGVTLTAVAVSASLLAACAGSATTRPDAVAVPDTLASIATINVPAPRPILAPEPRKRPALAVVAQHVTRERTDTVSISSLAANGIPTVAYNAYRNAASSTQGSYPGCGIDWALLAGIGRVESDHGRFAGAVLRSDGTSTPRIIGPALDGRKWDYIPAPSDGIALAGDATYAHALGPMQFIPSTWAMYGADGNGDGTADIFNVNDAALAAAHYLCAAGGTVMTPDGLRRAILAYNHNLTYLAQVTALAAAYRSGARVVDIPMFTVPKPHKPTAQPRHRAASARPAKAVSAAPAPRPTSTAARPKPAASTAPRTGTSAPAPSPTPTPTPTKTCIPLNHLLGLC